ncbi:hypothetical protein KAX01_02775 [Candidatus Bathyarchaeota archaeon]|nr:hypothetical protein [Candidatus Bathyarchaeota archaeon]
MGEEKLEAGEEKSAEREVVINVTKIVDDALNILKRVTQKVELPAVDKKEITKAIDLISNLKGTLGISRVTEILKILKGRQVEVKVTFNELKLDGTIGFSVTPLGKSEE